MTEAISMKTRGFLRRSFLISRNDSLQVWVFVMALIINFGERKVKDFDEDLQDEF